jgi:hypothetical protein
MLMGWPHPRIVDEQKTGPPHDPRFTVSCYFSKFKTFATSRSKKEAKRLAALDMHENMRYQPDIMYKYAMRTGRPMVGQSLLSSFQQFLPRFKNIQKSDFFSESFCNIRRQFRTDGFGSLRHTN